MKASHKSTFKTIFLIQKGKCQAMCHNSNLQEFPSSAYHSKPSFLHLTYTAYRSRLGSQTARTNSHRVALPSTLNYHLYFIAGASSY